LFLEIDDKPGETTSIVLIFPNPQLPMQTEPAFGKLHQRFHVLRLNFPGRYPVFFHNSSLILYIRLAASKRVRIMSELLLEKPRELPPHFASLRQRGDYLEHVARNRARQSLSSSADRAWARN